MYGSHWKYRLSVLVSLYLEGGQIYKPMSFRVFASQNLGFGPRSNSSEESESESWLSPGAVVILVRMTLS